MSTMKYKKKICVVRFIYMDHDFRHTGIRAFQVADSICTDMIDHDKIREAFDILGIEITSIETIEENTGD